MKLRILNIEQVALICGVSTLRVWRWIEKEELKISQPNTGENVNVLCEDLISFLVQHNMPLPESIIPLKAKKLLFVLPEELFDDVYYQFLIRFFKKIKRQANFIVDYIPYGPNAKMKLMIFKPNLVILDMAGVVAEAVNLAETIRTNEIFSSIKVMAIYEPDNYTHHLDVDSIVPRSIEITPLIEKIKTLLYQDIATDDKSVQSFEKGGQ